MDDAWWYWAIVAATVALYVMVMISTGTARAKVL